MKELAPFHDPIEGVTFVEASAGTGKTYAIEMLYLRLLVEHGMTPDEIVVVTYTNAAAAELRGRIRSRLRAALELVESGASGNGEEWQDFIAARGADAETRRRLLLALFEFDRAAISTIHGFCQRVLVEHAFDSGAAFDLEMITDQTALVDEVVRDFVAAELAATPRPLLGAVWGRESMVRLTRFAARAAAQPDLGVEPGGDEWGELLQRWQAAFATARDLWGREAEVITALRGSAAIGSRSRMTPERVVSAVSMVLDESAIFLAGRRKELEYLTATGVATRTTAGEDPPQHGFFDACQELFELEPQLQDRFRPAVFNDLADWARREIPGRKAAARRMYFDDLLLALRDALRGDSGPRLAEKLRGRFRAALIDEFQDTDPVQYEIFQSIFLDHLPMMLIGDPKQSIYGFRGADIHTYVAARADADREPTLGVNRRSTPAVVAAVNRLFSAPGAFVLPDISFHPAAAIDGVPSVDGVAGLTFLRWSSDDKPSERDLERLIARAIATRIVDLLASGATIEGSAVRAGHLAVLCRTNEQAATVQSELRERGVPSVLQGDRSVFDTEEAGEMLRVLQALVEPRDAGAIRAALCTSLCGASGDDVLRIEEDEGEWQIWSDRFRAWRTRWDESGFMAAYRRLQVDCGTWERLLSRHGGERGLTNYLHLGELLQVASRRQRGGAQGLLDWLALMTSEVGARGEIAAEDVQVRLESEEDAVVLTTVHKSKGLEYPIVFVPFAWKKVGLKNDDQELPRYHAGGRRRVYVGAAAITEKRALAETEQLAEEMRLTYVGLTRARNACFAVVTDTAKAVVSAMSRLASDPDALRAADAGSIAVEELRIDGRRLPRVAAAAQIAEPAVPVAPPGGWRVASFSALTRDSEALAIEEEAGVDRDAVEDVAVVAGGEPDSPVVLADLESGPRIGSMLHAVFEDLDFRAADSGVLRALVERKVRAFRGREERVDSICRSTTGVLRAPLPGLRGSLVLSEVGLGDRLNELEFILPVRAGGGRLTPRTIADVLLRHGAPAADPGYAERVAALGFSAFAGYLRGYVDLVFVRDGVWYVVDYKSNYLGARWADYAPPRLTAPMSHHHYFLQYLLYVVAVDRHLARTVAGYTYEEGFGGVHYLFLRGMAADRPGNGVFYDRPAPALIADLSALFDGEDGDG